jgi:hypothetical protein
MEIRRRKNVLFFEEKQNLLSDLPASSSPVGSSRTLFERAANGLGETEA